MTDQKSQELQPKDMLEKTEAKGKQEDPISDDVNLEEVEESKVPSVLGTLLWKNFTLKRKRKQATLCEILVPAFFIVLVMALKSLTEIQNIPTGWSADFESFCPYTNEVAVSQLVQVPCGLPYQAFFEDTNTQQEFFNYISGSDSRHPFARLFFIHSGDEREINAMNLFISFVETEGIAESGSFANFGDAVFIQGDGSNEAFQNYATSTDYGEPFSDEAPEIAVGIFFQEMDFENGKFDYTLRLNDTSVADFLEAESTNVDPVDELQNVIEMDRTELYMDEGFVALQQLVDSFIIRHAFDNYTAFPTVSIDSEEDDDFVRERKIFQPSNIRAVGFPINGLQRDIFFLLIQDLLPLIFILVYLMPVSQVVSVIVLEKEVRAREMMRLMGVSDFKIILSWYITYMAFFAILSFIVTVFGFSIFPSTTEAGGGFSLLIFFVFFFFGLATIAFCFVMSTFFQKAFNGVVGGLMIYIIFFFMFYWFENFDEIPNWGLLLPQTAFAFTIKTLAVFEEQGIGASSALIDFEIEGFAISRGLGWMFFDFIYLTILGLYLNSVVPGEFGAPLPWYFPFELKFWKDLMKEFRRNGNSNEEKQNESYEKHVGNNVEDVNDTLMSQLKNQVGMQIRGLTKVFNTPDGPKKAVDDLSFDVFEGQILVLLGHNGAGKTTTLQMLSGTLGPTEGDAIIYGKKLTQDLAAIRRDLGFCPQHDVLYKELSVYDHLKFYALIKGVPKKKLESAIQESIEQVGLTEKKFIRSSSLSGGMKRKLSLAISLVGDSRLIFVDEPTSGVDTFSRRAMWEVLQNCREGRVIILTTHFMDEADLLGDRIAIMAEGKLQCIGSSLFLKNLYGAGYQLTFVKEKKCDSDDVEEVIKKYVEGANVTADIGTELSFYLPLKESQSFSALFRELDDLIEKKELQVAGYGVSVTTMEEVFLKAGQSDDLLEGAQDFQRMKSQKIKNNLADELELNEEEMEEDQNLTFKQGAMKTFTKFTKLPGDIAQTNPFTRQLFALFMKRINYAKRDCYSFFCNTLVPVTIFCVGLAVLTFAPFFESSPSMLLTTDQWNQDFIQRGFLPVLELTSENELSFEETRILQQENFDSFRVEEPFEARSSSFDTGEIRTLFDQGYVNGKSNNCTAFYPCPDDFPNETGSAILDFGEAFLTPEESFQIQIEERLGASDFSAVIVQTEQIVQTDGLCFLADISVDTDNLLIVVDTTTQECSDATSNCVMMEFTSTFGDTEIFTCLPSGCLSDFDEEGFDSLLAVFGGELPFGGEISDEDDLDAFLNSTSMFYCEGNFCNGAPSSIEDFSICRNGDTNESLDELCVVDGLIEIDLNITIDEDEDVTLTLSIDEEANYCTARTFGENENDVLPESTVASVSSRRLQNASDEFSCLKSTLSEELDDFVEILTLLEGSFDDFDPSPTFDDENEICIDESFSCSAAQISFNGSSICIVDSCLSEEEKSEILSAIVGDLAANITDLLDAQSDIECVDFSTECDQVVDLGESGAFLAALTSSGALEVLLDSELLDFFLDLIETSSNETSTNSTSRLLSSAADESEFLVVKKVLHRFRQLQIDANVSEVCEQVSCETLVLGDVCVQIDCEAELEERISNLFGSVIGQIVISTGFETTPCENSTCLTNATLDLTEISDDILESLIRNLTGLSDELQTEITLSIVAIATQVIFSDPTSVEDVVSALLALDEDAINSFADLLSEINGIDISGEEITTLLEAAEAVAVILDLALNDQETLITFLIAAVNSAESEVEICEDQLDVCVLTEVTIDDEIICFPAGCSQSVFDYSSVLESSESFATEINADSFFIYTCDVDQCNDGCQSPSNCDAEDYTAVRLNSTDDSLIDFSELCINTRYTYTMLLNTTARHAAIIVANGMHSALLRRSLVEYLNFSDPAFDDLEVSFTGNSDLFSNLEGGRFGTIEARFSFPSGTGPEIITRSHPMPFTSTLQSIIEGILAFTASIFCLLAFAFIPGPMISYVVMEKEEDVQIKHLQFVSGAGIVSYWISNFLFDLLSYMIPFSLSLGLILLFDVSSFIDNGAFQVVAVVFLGYGVAIIPFSYLLGHLFKKHTTALIWIIIINCLTGLTLMIASYAMENIPSTEEVAGKIKWFYRIFPGFCLGDSLLQIATTSIIRGFIGEDAVDGFYSRDVAGANVTFLYTEAFVFMFLVIAIEYIKTQPGLVQRLLPEKDLGDEIKDEIDVDVVLEEERVLKDHELIQTLKEKGELNEESGVSEDVLRMIKLRKVYGNGKVAVKNVSLGIPEGECFGYLGINGAGKTTTMKCLTGDIFPTSGTGFIRGHNIVSDQGNVRQHVGYCSQFSSILGLLTVREHLELFCNVKLVEDVEGTVKTLLKRLSLVPFENKLAKSLSGGNKRKLNVAIAMVGSPAVMLLDEPSTGMDVASRRFMWNVIENMSNGRYDGKKTSVVLTTHSMEECEALCSRVGIMVGGRLRCLGSVQHLKSRFGKGFTIETKLEYISAAEIKERMKTAELENLVIKETDVEEACERLGDSNRFKKMQSNENGSAWVIMRKLQSAGEIGTEPFVEWFLQQERVDAMKEFLQSNFSGFEVVEAHDYQLTFRVEKDATTRLSTLFEALEGHKGKLKIAEYAVSQTTLEQIFNGFAAQQEEENGVPRGMVVEKAEVEEVKEGEQKVSEETL